MVETLQKWIVSLQGKFILVASTCILIFTVSGSFFIIEREANLHKQDILNHGKTLSEISRLMLTNVMVYKELGMMDEQDLTDYLYYFIVNLMQQDSRVRLVSVYDNSGAVIACNDAFKQGTLCLEPAASNIIGNLEPVITYADHHAEPAIDISTPLNISTKSWGSLRIIISTKRIEELIESLKSEIFFIALVFSLLSLMIVSVGARVLSRPVTGLSRIMDKIKTHGDIESSSPEFSNRRDEIGDLQRSFLWMLQRLREADKEHKKTLEVLSQTEKMVSVGRLASGIAHEINNPLGGITLCFKNLIGENADHPNREKLIEAINDGLQKIKKIVEQLLDFSRMSVTEKTPVDINSMINRLLVFFNYAASKKNIRIVNDYMEQMPPMLIDENKMSQVFMNIIINAVQSMENGGVLTIRTGIEDGFCVISFGDTGEGIPPEIIANVFEPFFTTKGVGEGTGLGLSVSKGIIEQHGGIIEVDSKVGVGTTFRIKLPV